VKQGQPRWVAGSIEVWDITFWVSVKRAKEDILAVLKDGLPSIQSATTLLLTEDLSDRQAAIHRKYTFHRAELKRSLSKLVEAAGRQVDVLMPPAGYREP